MGKVAEGRGGFPGVIPGATGGKEFAGVRVDALDGGGEVVPVAESEVVLDAAGVAVEELGRVDLVAVDVFVGGGVPVCGVDAAGGDGRQAESSLVVAEFLGVVGDDAALIPIGFKLKVGGGGVRDWDGADVLQAGAQIAARYGVGAAPGEGAPETLVEAGAVEVLLDGDQRVVLWRVRGGRPRCEAGHELYPVRDYIAVCAVVANRDRGDGARLRGHGGEVVPDAAVDALVDQNGSAAVREGDVDRRVGRAIGRRRPAQVDIVESPRGKFGSECVGGGGRRACRGRREKRCGAIGAGEPRRAPRAGERNARGDVARRGVVKQQSGRCPDSARAWTLAARAERADGVIVTRARLRGGVDEVRGG